MSESKGALTLSLYPPAPSGGLSELLGLLSEGCRRANMPQLEALWRAQTGTILDPAFTASLTRYSEGLTLETPQAQCVYGVSRTGTTGS